MGWKNGFHFPAEARDFLHSTMTADRLWGPPSLLSSGYQGFFLWRGTYASDGITELSFSENKFPLLILYNFSEIVI
jgi:hypothetical protein